MYREAQRHLRNENFSLAVRTLQMLESRYPFGRYAEQAQLELIYAHYGAYSFAAATEAADRFIRLHPRHPNVDYAFYMKGLAAYDIEPGFFSRFIPSDDTKRDVSHIQIAFGEFAQLLARYPDSAYAPDARQRMIHMRNMLARHEVHVANYYFRRGAYLAALNRGKYVVEHMQQTPSVADGLAIMAQAYLLLGIDDLAEDAVDVLCENYPDHPNLKDGCAFNSVFTADGLQRSWINRATLGLFDPPKPPQFNYRSKS
jgi:outer membrane protein assembly factor BamD